VLLFRDVVLSERKKRLAESGGDEQTIVVKATMASGEE
jgi:hypothetical protein